MPPRLLVPASFRAIEKTVAEMKGRPLVSEVTRRRNAPLFEVDGDEEKLRQLVVELERIAPLPRMYFAHIPSGKEPAARLVATP